MGLEELDVWKSCPREKSFFERVKWSFKNPCYKTLYLAWLSCNLTFYPIYLGNVSTARLKKFEESTISFDNYKNNFKNYINYYPIKTASAGLDASLLGILGYRLYKYRPKKNSK